MKRFKKMLAVVMAAIILMSALPMAGASALTIFPELTLNEPVDVSLDSVNKIYTFTPQTDGLYKFYSVGEADTFATLYENFTSIAENDDGDNDQNFSFLVALEAGQKYILNIGANVESEEAVSVQVFVEESIDVKSIEITQYPFNMTVVEGFEMETVDCTGLEAKFTLTDGSVVDWTYEESGLVADMEVNVYSETNDSGVYTYISCGSLTEAIEHEVIENMVESIEYISETPIMLYENFDGDYREDGGFIYAYSVPEDAKIIVNYKDGTSETFSFYDLEGDLYYYDNQYEELWGVDKENRVNVSYFGAETSFSVTILACPFKNVTVNSVPSKEYFYRDLEMGYIDADDNYVLSPIDITGLSFTVEYEDGTTQTYDDDDFDVENMLIDGSAYYMEDCVITGPGMVDVTLKYKGGEIKYQIEIQPEKEILLGDVDGDGEVTIIDATAVQRHVAQLETLEYNASLAGDVDGDSDVTIVDATIIQRLVAQIIDKF